MNSVPTGGPHLASAGLSGRWDDTDVIDGRKGLLSPHPGRASSFQGCAPSPGMGAPGGGLSGAASLAVRQALWGLAFSGAPLLAFGGCFSLAHPGARNGSAACEMGPLWVRPKRLAPVQGGDQRSWDAGRLVRISRPSAQGHGELNSPTWGESLELACPLPTSAQH